MEKLNLNRDFYSAQIGMIRSNLAQKKALEDRVKVLDKSLIENQTLYVRMLDAQKVLATVSDENTNKTLNYITSMVNKVLLEIFPRDPYSIKLTPKLYQGSRPHVVVELFDSEGHVLDVSTQSGDGIKQVICFMYVICLIEIRKGRRLLILDERLNGLHKSAKNCISKIIEIFAKGGFQFIFVEYSLNDIGKIYNVERVGGKHKQSRLVEVDGDYSDSMVYFDSKVDLSALDDEYDEEEGYSEEKEYSDDSWVGYAE